MNYKCKIFQLSIILVIIESFQTLNIKLFQQKFEFPDSLYPAYEEVYVSNVQYGNEDQNFITETIFDLCSSSSWIITSDTQIIAQNKNYKGEYECLPPACVKQKQLGQEAMYAYGNQAQFTGVLGKDDQLYTHEIAKNTINIQGKTLKNIGFWLPLKMIKANSGETPLVNKQIQASLGLGPLLIQYALAKKDYSKRYLPFPYYYQQNTQAEKEFSFFFGKNVKQLIVGNHEPYFVKPGSQWVYFKNQRDVSLQSTSKNNYALYLPKIEIDDVSQVSTQTQNPWTKQISVSQYAILDSTTKYIWFGDAQILTNIVNLINNKLNTQCQLFNQTIYTCPQSVKQFPKITFYLTDSKVLDSPKYVKFNLNQEDYTEEYFDESFNSKRVFLLLRPGFYGDQQSQINQYPNIWFGQPFMNKFYTRFIYSNDTIALSEPYEIPMTPLHISSSFYTYTLSIGSLLMVVLVILLMISFKTVSYQKKVKKNRRPNNNNINTQQSYQHNQSQEWRPRSNSQIKKRGLRTSVQLNNRNQNFNESLFNANNNNINDQSLVGNNATHLNTTINNDLNGTFVQDYNQNLFNNNNQQQQSFYQFNNNNQHQQSQQQLLHNQSQSFLQQQPMFQNSVQQQQPINQFQARYQQYVNQSQQQNVSQQQNNNNIDFTNSMFNQN